MIHDTDEIESTEHPEESFTYAALSRRDIRALVIHLMYALEAFDYEVSLGSIVDNLNRGFDLDIPIESDAVTLTKAIVEERTQLDEMVKPFLANWRLERLGLCTRLIVRLAFWELMHSDIPISVIINEAVELAKCFSEKDAYKFVNGLLDQAAKQLRSEAPV